jgi:mono/diheme cytochrome c family protein
MWKYAKMSGKYRVSLKVNLLGALLAFLVTSCGGLASLPGAGTVQTSALTSSSSTASLSQCNLTVYQATISPIITSQCIACHGSPGSGSLLLQAETTETGVQANYTSILAYIESDAASADNTSLMGRVSGGLTHPLKLSAGSTTADAFENFTDGVLTDPTCSAGATATPAPVGI